MRCLYLILPKYLNEVARNLTQLAIMYTRTLPSAWHYMPSGIMQCKQAMGC